MIIFRVISKRLLISDCKNYKIVIIKASELKLYSCHRLKNQTPEIWESINETSCYVSYHQARNRISEVHKVEPEKAILENPNRKKITDKVTGNSFIKQLKSVLNV